MAEPEGDDGLEALAARIAEAQRRNAGQSAGPKLSDDMSGRFAGVAFRLGIELFAAFAVSVFIGWALDRWLGTRPWLMVAFFFLGAATGVLNVYRAVKNMGLAQGSGQTDGTGRKETDRT